MKEFLTLVFSYGTINVFQKIIDYFSIALFVSLFSAEDYGLISLNTILIFSLTSIVSLSLDGSLTRYYHKYVNEGKIQEFMGSIVSYLLLLLCVMAFLLLIPLKPVIILIFRDVEFYPYIFLVILISVIDPINRFYIAYLQIKKDIKKYAIYYNSYVLTKLFSLILIAFIFQSTEFYFFAYLFSTFIFSLFTLFKLNRVICWNLKFEYFITAISYSIYYLPVILLVGLNSLVDRTYILNQLDLSSVGVYSAGSNIGNIVYLIAVIFNLAYVPIFIQSYEKSEHTFIDYTSEFSDLFVFCVLFSAFLVSIFSPFIANLLPFEYAQAALIVPVFAFVGVFNGLYFYYTNFMSLNKKLMRYKLLGVSLGFIANIGLTGVLVVHFGMLGAAFGTLVSVVIGSFVLKYLCVKVGGFALNNKYFISSISVFFISFFVVFLSTILPVYYIFIVNLGLIAIVLACFNLHFFVEKNYIIKNLKMVKNNVKIINIK